MTAYLIGAPARPACTCLAASDLAGQAPGAKKLLLFWFEVTFKVDDDTSLRHDDDTRRTTHTLPPPYYTADDTH